jgi:hypothetical protein
MLCLFAKARKSLSRPSFLRALRHAETIPSDLREERVWAWAAATYAGMALILHHNDYNHGTGDAGLLAGITRDTARRALEVGVQR